MLHYPLGYQLYSRRLQSILSYYVTGIICMHLRGRYTLRIMSYFMLILNTVRVTCCWKGVTAYNTPGCTPFQLGSSTPHTVHTTTNFDFALILCKDIPLECCYPHDRMCNVSILCSTPPVCVFYVYIIPTPFLT